MPQLDPTWFASQLFWLAVTFALLYFIMSRLVLPPLQEIIARRHNTVTGDISQAESLKSQAEQARSDYERTLASAREQAQGTIRQAVESYKAKSESASKEIDRQIELKLTNASKRIADKKAEMMQALTPTMGDLTSLIFEKLTQAKPSNEQVHRILNELEKNRR